MKVKNPQLTAHSQTLRKRMTPEERKLWYEFLKRLPFTVHRQKVMGRYIVDFYLPSLRIVIEIDGMQHGDIVQARKDAQRDAWLNELVSSAALYQLPGQYGLWRCVRGHLACMRLDR